MPEPHRSRHDSYVHRYLQTGQVRIIGSGRELDAFRKDGTTFPIDLAISETRVAGRVIFRKLWRRSRSANGDDSGGSSTMDAASI